MNWLLRSRVLPVATPQQSIEVRCSQGLRRATVAGVDVIASFGDEPCGAFCFFPPLTMSESKVTPNKPWKVFRSNGVVASVFHNTVKTPEGERIYAKVSLSRTYREGNEFKSTTSLGRDDLPVAALLLQQAWANIVNSETDADAK